MKVRAVLSFSGSEPGGGSFSIQEGQVFELPEGTDWLEAGLVVPVDEPAPEVEFAVSVRDEKVKNLNAKAQRGKGSKVKTEED